MSAHMKWLAGVLGTAATIIAIWTALGLPQVAWTTDIKRLDRGQANNAVHQYQSDIRSLLSVAPPKDPVAKQKWDEYLDEAHQGLKAARERLQELSK